jgi:reductive dehalogenase
LKLLGIGSASVGVGAAAEVIGKTANGAVISSPEEHGGFVVEKLNDQRQSYLYDESVLQRMSDKDTVFSRNRWDTKRKKQLDESEDTAQRDLIEGQGRLPNQTHLDYAFYSASWFNAMVHGSSCYQWQAHPPTVRFEEMTDLGKWDPASLGMSWADASLAVKHAACFYGASLAGIAKLNPLWLYRDSYSPTDQDIERTIPVLADGERFGQTEDAWFIPESMNRVVSLAFEEDFYGIANSPGRLASAAVGNGYSRMAFTAATLAEFIRGLGYRAIPAGNGVGLSVPMAIDAGLGELGRNGLLITPKYGPRVRLAKVITDMPLITDAAIDFGVREFCETCLLCAEQCPSSSITEGPQTWEGCSVSNSNGVYKWYIQSEQCYDFNGFSCSNCKRVCPFTKPNNSWLHQMLRQIIRARIAPVNSFLTRLDQLSGYGEQIPDRKFWSASGSRTITGREIPDTV